MLKNKKGQNAAVVGSFTLLVGLLFLGILLSLGLDVMGTIQNEQGESSCGDAGGFWNETNQVCQTSDADPTPIAGNPSSYNVSGDVLSGGTNFSGQMPTIFLVGAVTLVIASLLGAFAFLNFRNQ